MVHTCNKLKWINDFTLSELYHNCGLKSFKASNDTHPLLNVGNSAVDNGECLSCSLLPHEVSMILSKSRSIMSDSHGVRLFDGNIVKIELLSFVSNYMALDTNGSKKTNIIMTNFLVHSIVLIKMIQLVAICLFKDEYRWHKWILSVKFIKYDSIN